MLRIQTLFLQLILEKGLPVQVLHVLGPLGFRKATMGLNENHGRGHQQEPDPHRRPLVDPFPQWEDDSSDLRLQ